MTSISRKVRRAATGAALAVTAALAAAVPGTAPALAAPGDRVDISYYLAEHIAGFAEIEYVISGPSYYRQSFPGPRGQASIPVEQPGTYTISARCIVPFNSGDGSGVCPNATEGQSVGYSGQASAVAILSGQSWAAWRRANLVNSNWANLGSFTVR